MQIKSQDRAYQEGVHKCSGIMFAMRNSQSLGNQVF